MKRSRELEALTRELYRAVSGADPGFFERHLARRCVVIGTEPGEWWDDREAALKAIRAQMKALGTSIRLSGRPRAWREGDAGWVSDRPRLKLGKLDVLCRHTSVFVRQGGAWRITQHHFSIGVP